MLGLKLNHVSKRGHWSSDTMANEPVHVYLDKRNQIEFYGEVCQVSHHHNTVTHEPDV